jgi:hypothetical protein
VAHNQPRHPLAAHPPHRARRRDKVRDRPVKAAHPPGDLHQGVPGIHPPRPRPRAAHRLARQERQHLPSLRIEPQRPRAAGKALVSQVRQQRVDRRRPLPGRPPHGAAHPHRPAGIAAVQTNLHPARMPASTPPGIPGR